MNRLSYEGLSRIKERLRDAYERGDYDEIREIKRNYGDDVRYTSSCADSDPDDYPSRGLIDDINDMW